MKRKFKKTYKKETKILSELGKGKLIFLQSVYLRIYEDLSLLTDWRGNIAASPVVSLGTAGSARLERIGATGSMTKEQISINYSLVSNVL